LRTRSRPVLALVAAGAVTLALAVPAAAGAAYGAIAVNPATGAAGISWNYPTQDGAKRRAERQCAGRCRIAIWVRNQCAAVVETQSRYVPGLGPTKKKALRKARKRAHNPQAHRVAWVCSG
jgi:hypothetical protein